MTAKQLFLLSPVLLEIQPGESARINVNKNGGITVQVDSASPRDRRKGSTRFYGLTPKLETSQELYLLHGETLIPGPCLPE